MTQSHNSSFTPTPLSVYPLTSSSCCTRQSVSARRMGLSARAVARDRVGAGTATLTMTVTRSISSSRRSLCVWHLASGNYADAANCWPGLVWSGLGVSTASRALLCHLPGQSAASAVVHAHTCPFMSFVSRICCSACASPAAPLLLPLPLLLRLHSSLNTHTHTQPAPALMSSRPHEGIWCARCGTVNPFSSSPPASPPALDSCEAATLHPQLIASPLARLLCHTSGCKLWHISNT